MVDFPVEDGQLLTQGEILRRERCSVCNQTPDEPEERGNEDHKCEANHRKKDETDDQTEWPMIALTASNSRQDEVFGRDRSDRSSGDLLFFRVSWYFDLLEIIDVHLVMRLAFTRDIDVGEFLYGFPYSDACSVFSEFCRHAIQCVSVFAVLELEVHATAAGIV